MLNISGISKNNSASFGNQPRIIVMQPHENTMHLNDMPSDSVEIRDVDYEPVSDPIIDEEKEYEEQKNFLNTAKSNVEATMNNVEGIIDETISNSKIGKPIKTFGKVILGAISIAMGFVSMKWAALGTWKVAENVVTSPIAKNIAGGMAKPFKEGYKAVAGAVEKGKLGERLKASSLGKSLEELSSKLAENKYYKQGKEILDTITGAVSPKVESAKQRLNALEVTKDKIKNVTANFFGVSGGVTAGVETIQSSKDDKAA